jgi:hypothetical protein
MSKLHRHVIGVPKLTIPDNCNSCPVCLQAKLNKAAQCHDDICRATTPYQGLSVNFGFFVQQSNDSAQVAHLTGVNGETCYCLIVDHFSGAQFVQTFCSKAPSIGFLTEF